MFNRLAMLLAFATAAIVAATAITIVCLDSGPVTQLPDAESSLDYVGRSRSGRWPALRREFLAYNPVCYACGTTEDLNVHHIRSFHTNPKLELEWRNLITLCREHHFLIGHDPDGPFGPELPGWSKINPDVREDCVEYQIHEAGR